MNKVKLLLGKFSLVTVISLAFMVLGIGCIFWAIFSMWSQSGYSVDTTHSRYPIPTTFDAELNKLPGGNTATLESNYAIVLTPPGKILYPVYPIDGDIIGSLTIPALNRKLPIIQGTSVNDLKKGVGHFMQSVLPGEKDNCVLSGHRDTVFRQLGDLKTGDQLIVQTSAGIFTYKVNGTRIVHQDDKTVIVPSSKAVLTMTTCYPFYAIGYAPDRYIVSAVLATSK